MRIKTYCLISYEGYPKALQLNHFVLTLKAIRLYSYRANCFLFIQSINMSV